MRARAEEAVASLLLQQQRRVCGQELSRCGCAHWVRRATEGGKAWGEG